MTWLAPKHLWYSWQTSDDDTSHQKTLNTISYKHNLKMTISFYVQVEINLQGFVLMLTLNERDGQLRLKCKFHGYCMIKHVVTSTMVCHHWTAVCDKQQCHRMCTQLACSEYDLILHLPWTPLSFIISWKQPYKTAN